MIHSRFVRPFVNTFAVAFPSPIWLLLSLLTTGALIPVLFTLGFSEIPDRRDPLHYLLSAQAQTLATVFVLAFTFTFVSAQIASRYSQLLLNRIVGPWALWYAIPYGIGILLPLFLLNGWFFLWAARVSLLLMVYCIVSLISFAVAVRGLLLLSEAISEHRDRILAANTSCAEVRVSLRDLVNIIVGALNLKDYESFESGILQLEYIAKYADDRCALVQDVNSQLRRIVLRYLDDRFASDVIFRAMFSVALQGRNVSDSRGREEMLDHLADVCRLIDISVLRDHEDWIRLIKEFASDSIESQDQVTVSKSLMLFHIIAERAISEMTVESQFADAPILALGDVALMAMTSSLPDPSTLVMSVILRLEILGAKAETSKRTVVREAAERELHRIISSSTNRDERIVHAAEASLGVLGAY